MNTKMVCPKSLSGQHEYWCGSGGVIIGSGEYEVAGAIRDLINSWLI
jgi:hypothetical protein